MSLRIGVHHRRCCSAAVVIPLLERVLLLGVELRPLLETGVLPSALPFAVCFLSGLTANKDLPSAADGKD